VSFRTRLTLASAAAVALAIALASGLVYVLVRDQLRGEVKASLDQRAALLTSLPLSIRETPDGTRVLVTPYRGLAQGDVFLQAVDSEGQVAKPDPRQPAFPVTDETVRISYGAQLPRTVQMVVLAILWAVALWITRRPVRR